MLESMPGLFAAAGDASAAEIGRNLLEGSAIDGIVGAIRQLLLWFDLFESDELNRSLNVVLGVVEGLGGAVLISMGLRQLDLTDPAEGEGLRRVARRTTGEAVKTVLGHLLRLVGIVRGSAGLLLLFGNLL